MSVKFLSQNDVAGGVQGKLLRSPVKVGPEFCDQFYLVPGNPSCLWKAFLKALFLRQGGAEVEGAALYDKVIVCLGFDRADADVVFRAAVSLDEANLHNLALVQGLFS